MIGKKLKKLLCTLGVIIGITCNTVYSANVDSIQLRGEWTGDKKVVKPLVLLIDFNNYTFEDMKKEVTPRDFKDWGVQHYKDMCFGDEEYKGPKGENLISMKEYYKEQSGGSFIVEGDVFGWYTAKKDAEYYGKHYGVTKDANIEELVKEAFDMALEDPNIDLSQYDTDKNGVVDSLVIVHAGKGQEVGGGTLGADAIWAHRNSLTESVYYGKNNSNIGQIGVSDYVIVPQDMGIGVMSHEYGHILGLNDEYNIHSSEKASPIGYWSIMAGGSGAGISHGTDPTGFSPWCKQYLQKTLGGNWANIREFNLDDIDESGIDILLDEASRKGINNEVIRINLPKDTLSKDRYYLLEWRNNSGTDRSLSNCEGGPLNYDSGLVIWYIDENYSNSLEYDNNVAKHPGYGFSGVVDADQHIIHWRDEETNEIVEKASSDYQIHDAAFRLKKGKDIYVSGMLNKPGLVAIDEETFMKPIFDDSRDYSNEGVSEAGRILPKHGLKIYVTGQSSDGSVGKIHILKNNNFVYKNNILDSDITSSFVRNITLDKNVIEKDDKAVITVELNEEKPNNEIVLCYVVQENGKEEEKYLTLNNFDGKYVGDICKDNDFKIGNWKIKYIVIEDEDENEDAEIIYNAYTNDIVSREVNKEDFSGGNLSIVEQEDKGFKIENTTKVNTFVLGENAEISINALNEGVVPKEITLITALYDSNNMLLKYAQNNEVVNFTEHKEIKTILDLKEGLSYKENYIIKAFIWDNLQEIKPLMNYFQYNTVSMKDMEEDGINEFREAIAPENIRTLLESELDYIEIDLKEYVGLSEELKGCVVEKIFNKKDEIVSKENLQNVIDASIVEAKLDQYRNATTGIIMEKVLESEPNILGVDTEEYKKLAQDMKGMICSRLAEKHNELNNKETIQEFLNTFIEDEINVENARKAIEDFNDYMYDTWFIDESNINYVEEYLNSSIEALKKLDCETKNRYENNDEYKKNKEKVAKARETVEATNEILAQFQNSESVEGIKELLENSNKNLGINFSEYEKLEEDNKLIVIKDLYDNRESLSTKNDIEKVMKESIGKIEEESMDSGVSKYMKCESEEEFKSLLDTMHNELELETHLYNKMNEDNKNYVARELYKHKDKFNSKESIQDKLDEVVADTMLSTLEEEYFNYYGVEGAEFVEGMEPLFNDATEALEKIGDPHIREIIKSDYMSYKEINNKLKEMKNGKY